MSIVRNLVPRLLILSLLTRLHCTLSCINSSLGKKILFAQGWICPGMDLLWGAGVHTPPLALALARGVQGGVLISSKQVKTLV